MTNYTLQLVLAKDNQVRAAKVAKTMAQRSEAAERLAHLIDTLPRPKPQRANRRERMVAVLTNMTAFFFGTWIN